MQQCCAYSHLVRLLSDAPKETGVYASLLGREIFSDVVAHALLGAIYGEHILPQVTCTRKRPTLKPEAATDTYDTLQQL